MYALGAAVGCAGLSFGAGPESPFTEESVARGVNYLVQAGGSHFGSGVGAFDIDNDGDPDLLVTGAADGRIGLYENDGNGHFIDRTYDELGNPRLAPSTATAGISAADYNGDGFLDIHIVRVNQPDSLYRNDGNWNFTDVAVEAGVANTGYGFSVAWGDYNGDGHPDFYLSNRTLTLANTVQNALYRNNGDGTFTDVAADLGVDAFNEPTLVATFFDYDRDGDPDLYLGTDKGTGPQFTNHLFRNDGGVFTDVTAFSGTEANVDCMGIAVGDLDRNGWPDIYVTNTPPGNVLLMNNGNGTFTDRTLDAGAGVFQIGWGTACIDYNNDTFEDLYVCNMLAENALLRNPGSFPLENVAQQMGVNVPSTSYVVTVADINNNGALDMVVAEYGHPVRVFINNEGVKRNWIKLNVQGEGANTFAIGTEVRLHTTATGTQWREIRSGHHYKSQDPTTVHFGINTETNVDKLFIRWPHTGTQRILQNYPVNTTLTIHTPDRMGDINQDGAFDTTDRRLALEFYRDEGTQRVRPGIEMMDMDGNGTVNAADIALIVGQSRDRPMIAPAGATGGVGQGKQGFEF